MLCEQLSTGYNCTHCHVCVTFKLLLLWGLFSAISQISGVLVPWHLLKWLRQMISSLSSCHYCESCDRFQTTNQLYDNWSPPLLGADEVSAADAIVSIPYMLLLKVSEHACEALSNMHVSITDAQTTPQ
jgi:hypothetical protein